MRLALLALAACASSAGGHVGPVAASAAVDGRTFACSQAGVFETLSGAARFVADPGFRPFALAAARGFLLVGGGAPAQSGELALFDLEGRPVARAHVADDLVYGVALAPEKALAAAACADGTVHVFALPALTRTATRWRHEGPAVAAAFAPGGALLASAGRDGKILLGDPVGDARPLALLDHTAAVTCLAWSADGERLASGAADGKVRLHERTGRLVHTWSRLGGAVLTVELRADRVVATIEGAPGEPPRAIEIDLR